jgi:hypothetical protein
MDHQLLLGAGSESRPEPASPADATAETLFCEYLDLRNTGRVSGVVA